ncbi:Secreted protein [Pseudomonas sp. IT-196MI5]
MLRRVWRFMMVCSGVLVGGYGADVTPGIFYENFIDVMVNIDGNDRTRAMPLVSVMMRSSDGRCVTVGGFYTG